MTYASVSSSHTSVSNGKNSVPSSYLAIKWKTYWVNPGLCSLPQESKVWCKCQHQNTDKTLELCCHLWVIYIVFVFLWSTERNVFLFCFLHTPREGRAAQTHFLCYVKRVEGPGVGSHSRTSLLTKAFILYTQKASMEILTFVRRQVGSFLLWSGLQTYNCVKLTLALNVILNIAFLLSNICKGRYN